MLSAVMYSYLSQKMQGRVCVCGSCMAQQETKAWLHGAESQALVAYISGHFKKDMKRSTKQLMSHYSVFPIW